MNGNVTRQSNRQEENCSGSCSGGLKNQIWERLVNLCESNILETQVIFPIYGLDRTLFQSTNNLKSFRSTNDMKIKITHHRISYMM